MSTSKIYNAQCGHLLERTCALASPTSLVWHSGDIYLKGIPSKKRQIFWLALKTPICSDPNKCLLSIDPISIKSMMLKVIFTFLDIARAKKISATMQSLNRGYSCFCTSIIGLEPVTSLGLCGWKEMCPVVAPLPYADFIKWSWTWNINSS